MADGTGQRIAAASGGIPAALDVRLAVWLSPAFPVGAFAYSHGLEMAAERGWVNDQASLQAWIADLVELGSIGNDMILLAAAWRAQMADDGAVLDEVNALALALQPSAERHLETVSQGNAFASAVAAAWAVPTPPAHSPPLTGDVAYPVAVGSAAADHAIALDGTLAAFGVALVSSLVSAAIRLSVIGQTDGQRVIAALMPAIARAATAAAIATLDDLGSLTLRSDIASLAHETQYSRLFRS